MEVVCLALEHLSSPRKSLRAGLEEGGVSHNEQKENIFVEKRRSATSLKSPDPSAALVALGMKSPAPDLGHATPIKHSADTEPLTPTANLKMLISAASPDIRDREMRKVLFRPIENEGAEPATAEDVEEDDECQPEGAEEESDPDRKPSRKQKSLGLLCHKFLALYPENPPAHSPVWISLDEVSASLGVERRRIYDIINVLESLAMVGRIAKNSYTWFGRRRLEATLQELQRRGRQQGPPLHAEEAGEGGAEGDAACGNRKDKSLRIMSQKFVTLFLVSRTQTVTLDAAARTLIDESQDLSSHSKYKTKVRRLYDIANVLTSLGLIKKVHVREERGRKPAFKWLGPVHFHTPGNAVSGAQPLDVQDFRRAKMSRHASFNAMPIVAAAAAAQRQVNSAPCSPLSECSESLQNQPLDYSRKTGGSSRSTATQLHSENGSVGSTSSSFASPTTSSPPLPAPPHCLAYLPSLSQPSVVMLYRPEHIAEGQGSPEGRKRRRSDGAEGTKLHVSEGHEKLIAATASPRQSAQLTPDEGPSGGGEPPQYSHYLYVPNSAGLNSLNFLLSAGQQPSGLTLTPTPTPGSGLAPTPGSGGPTLALPYVLLPTSTLPLEERSHMSFALMQPRVVVGGPAYALATAADTGGSLPPPPSTPERGGAKLQLSHCGPGQNSSLQDCMTPQTPKDTAASAASAASASKPFFRTPAHTVGSAVAAARRRGSAQRRLDVGHAPAQPLHS